MATLSLSSMACKIFTVFVMLGTLIPLAHANNVKVVQAIGDDNWDSARKTLGKTRDPVGINLYYWYWLKDIRNKDQDYKNFVKFIRQNPHFPDISYMRTRVEENMPNTLPATEYVAWFDDYPPITQRGLFLYIDGLIGVGRTAQAKKKIADWWTSKPLTRQDQKDLYLRYGRYIDKNMHLKRIDTLIESESYTNARAVADTLGSGYGALVEARIALRGEQNDVNTKIAAVPLSLRGDAGLQYERLRWRRRHKENAGAIEILMNPPSMRTVSKPKNWWMERHIMIRRLIEQRNHTGAYRLCKEHQQTEGFPKSQAENICGFIALRLINRPSAALEHFQELYNSVTTPISKGRGAYWTARSYDALGNQAEALRWYNIAAQYQTVFYGQAAGAKIGVSDSRLKQMLALPSDTIGENYKNDMLIKAAKTLNAAKLDDDARDFLQAFANSHESSESYAYASMLASNWRYYDTSLRIAKKAAQEGVLFNAQAYPIIPSYMRTGSDWALIHGIIRQESQFDTEIVSPAGAIGLMQLMPATANQTARKLGLSHSKTMLTTSPRHNIALGTAYINEMLGRYTGSYPLAVAAYNAGPSRVDRWLVEIGDPRLGEINMIDWVELIPIYETRNYVQRVLEASYVYGIRFQNVGTKAKINPPFHVL